MSLRHSNNEFHFKELFTRHVLNLTTEDPSKLALCLSKTTVLPSLMHANKLWFWTTQSQHTC